MNRSAMALIAATCVAAAVVGAALMLYFRASTPSYLPRPAAPQAPEPARAAAPQPALAPTAAREANPAPRPATQPALASGDEPLDVQELLAENRRLTETSRQLQGRLVDLLNWILVNYKGKFPLAEQHLAKLKLTPVTKDHRLSPEVSEFLRITPQEEEMINDAMAYANGIVKEIATDNTSIANPYPDKVVVRIPAFPEEGAAVREDLFAALEITLGADRFDRFMDVSKDGLETSFNRFGNASRTIIFELSYSDDENEQPLLTIKDGWVVQEEDGRKLIQATEATVEALPAEYSDYADAVPGGGQIPVEPVGQ